MIIRNGINYTNSVIELTWAEYSALSEEEKKNGTLYVVTDAPDDNYKASNIDYSNTKSGLSANNVQDAIDEVATSFSWKWIKTGGTWVDGNKLLNKFATFKSTSASETNIYKENSNINIVFVEILYFNNNGRIITPSVLNTMSISIEVKNNKELYLINMPVGWYIYYRIWGISSGNINTLKSSTNSLQSPIMMSPMATASSDTSNELINEFTNQIIDNSVSDEDVSEELPEVPMMDTTDTTDTTDDSIKEVEEEEVQE